MARLRQIVLVGHCGPDTWTLTRAVKRAVPDVAVAAVNDQASLDNLAHAGSLLLVNRVLDGAFDAEGGIELIRQFAQRADAPVMMLISNFEDAQAKAVQAGAQPGFGKHTMRSAAVADQLRSVVDQKAKAKSRPETTSPGATGGAKSMDEHPPAVSTNEPR